MERVEETQQPCDLGYVISVAPVDEKHPINRARWVKFVILLYRFDIEAGHCFPFSGPIPTTAVLNPGTSNACSVEDFLPWLYLETASFPHFHLTRTGTVLYLNNENNLMIVDEEGLKTGRFTMAKFGIDGNIEDSILLRPFNTEQVVMDLFEHGKRDLEELRESDGGRRYQNQP